MKCSVQCMIVYIYDTTTATATTANQIATCIYAYRVVENTRHRSIQGLRYRLRMVCYSSSVFCCNTFAELLLSMENESVLKSVLFRFFGLQYSAIALAVRYQRVSIHFRCNSHSIGMIVDVFFAH